jgi:hypothetical protein
MVWTILGQDRLSGKLESFVLLTDGTDSKNRAFSKASETVEVLAIIQGNHKGAVTLYEPPSSDLGLSLKTEAERMEDLRFMRCSEYWEGI